MGKKRQKKIVIFTILVIGLAVVGFLAYQYISLRNELADPNYLTKLQTDQQMQTKEKILTKLSAIMLLPDEPNPKIATISNIDQLKAENPGFYKNAQNGDTLVLYTELAIIYRDSNSKIINIAPIAQDSSSTSTTDKSK